MGIEAESPKAYFINQRRMSWVITGESYDGRAILDICVECNWLVIMDRTYMESQLDLP